MKLIFILPKSITQVGGVENFVKNIVQILEKKGHKIDILCTSWGIKGMRITNYTENIRIIEFRRIIFKNKFYYSPQLIKYFKKVTNQYDQIHVQSFHSLTSFVLFYSPREKTVFNPHFHPSSGKGTITRKLIFKFYLKLFSKKMIRNVSRFVVDTEHEKKILCDKFNLPEESVRVIPLAVPNNLKKAEPFSSKPEKILYVGRFVKQKGVLNVIEVFERLLPLFPQLKLDLVGSGPLIKAINKTIQRKNLEGKVQIYSNVSEQKLFDFYSQADLFLMLSKYEAFGIAIAEAIASGIPTIATSRGGVTSFVEDHVNGYLVKDPDDIDTVFNLATEILSDLNIRNKLRENGLKLKEKLSWEKTALAYLDALN